MLIGLVVWTGMALGGLATSFVFLLFVRMGVGVGEAVCAPAATSWLGVLPPHQRSRVLALFMLGVPVGGALTYSQRSIAQAWGWRTAMVVAALPVLILAPALAMLVEPERGAMETVRQKGGEVLVWKLLQIPTLWWIIASGVFVNFNMYAIGVFLPPLLSRVHKMTLAGPGWERGLRIWWAGYAGACWRGIWATD